MSDVLEGWIKIQTSLGPFNMDITSYSGDWTSSTVLLRFYLYNLNGEKIKNLGYYQKDTGWFLNTAGNIPPLSSDPYNVVLRNDSTQEEFVRRGVLINTYDVECPFYTLTTPLSTPTGLTADQITSTGARIGWNAVANATGYKVEYKPHNSNTWIEG